jgi:hypothetical protein
MNYINPSQNSVIQNAAVGFTFEQRTNIQITRIMKSSQHAAFPTLSVNPFPITSNTNFQHTETQIIDLADLYNRNADEPDFDCEFLGDAVLE